ncbi:MAG TPA: prepilin-type N-terminal cleavage/methylation domain-containing protein [Candidatus Saccharimonadales bacterium]
MTRRPALTARGFTIIEVLIVLVLAAVILLIIFLAVPSTRRTERNHERRQFVDFTAASMEEYLLANSGTGFADTPTQICSFITGYLAKNAGGDGTCAPSFIPSKDCVLYEASRFTICYHQRPTSSHAYVGPEDEVSIQLGHWCTPDPNPWPADDGHPITSGSSPTDSNVRRYVIWTKLERAGIYCRDNVIK